MGCPSSSTAHFNFFRIMEHTINIDINKKYSFPNKITSVNFHNKLLIISPETANWIVLTNKEQLVFFNLLKSNTITKAIELFSGTQSDIQEVLIQIEAKKFDSTYTQSATSGTENVHFYLTNECNLRCPHCYMFAGTKKDKELTTNEICSFLLNFSNNGGQSVIFSGGEISMRKDLVEICKCAHGCGLNVSLLTNGTLWTQATIHEISRFINEVQVSIDGYDEESNAKIRGKNNFAKSLATIDSFIMNGIHTTMAMTPFYDENLDSNCAKYVDFIKSMTDKYQNKNFDILVSAEMLDGRDVCLTNKDRDNYSRISNKIYSMYYNTDLSLYPFVQIHKQHRIMDNCIFGTIAISSTGDVFLCSQIERVVKIANIKENSIDEIIAISNKGKIASNINNLKPCNNCELKYICGGGCRLEYFPQLTQATDFDMLTTNNISPRKCSKKEKEHFYELMIKTNELIFQ